MVWVDYSCLKSQETQAIRNGLGDYSTLKEDKKLKQL